MMFLHPETDAGNLLKGVTKMIIDNVRIYQPSGEEKPEELYAVEFEGEYIKAVYPSPYQGEGPVIDGESRVLAPGFNDSHMHLLRYGLLVKELDLREADSFKEMKEMIQKHYGVLEEGQWIFGKGFNDAGFEDLERPLTAKDLNDIQVNAYIYLIHEDGHECVISENALDLLKEEKEFSRIPESFKERDTSGQMNGRFKDTAVHFINHRFWGRDKEEAKNAIKAALPRLSSYGITSVHTDDRSFIGSFARLYEAYTDLEQEGNLPIDVQLHHYVFHKDDITEFVEKETMRTGDGTASVTVGAVKLFLDGTQRLHTASMRNPYPDEPSKSGPLIYNQKEVNEMVRYAAQNQMQVAMHAIGDRAVEQAVTALEQEEACTKDLRHRLIHAQTLAPDLIGRISASHAYVETQPSFLLGEWDKKEKWVPEELVPFSDPYKSMKEAGIPFTLSSDLPIGSINPMVTVGTAVTRQDLEDQPEGGWMPGEKLTVDESFYGMGHAPAYLEFKEYRKGKVSPGYQADFVLLDQHPLESPPGRLKDIKVTETWHKGIQTYAESE
ncbi:metal-dependent hydrolase [Salimicrobium jeotgali]|uniref:Metal-dependent hydrolase n=2 Tax=Salimicrobium jeotgali TaxID=1230341 RepID=K2GDX7_9BACI|nr:metal-dependent hydrolase [Salimicrobium jeotgali]EKE32467.1 metal-dependent hydrolase [Salimicrobium jeotgali]